MVASRRSSQMTSPLLASQQVATPPSSIPKRSPSWRISEGFFGDAAFAFPNHLELRGGRGLGVGIDGFAFSCRV